MSSLAKIANLNLHGEGKDTAPFGRALRKNFLFHPKYNNLNHGSFGTYPKVVQAQMRKFQDAAEARPDAFIRYDSVGVIDDARAAMAKLLNAPVETLVFVPNATTGVGTVLRALEYAPGDKIVHFATMYAACEKSVQYIAETTPAEGVKIEYTYPVEDDWLVDELKRTVEKEKAAGNRVRLVIFDTVVSLPGVRMPFEKLSKACKELGVLSLIDAAHGVGHVELDLTALDCDFVVSNCHKWLYAPRGCAIFYVPVRNQPLIRSTLPTSHGFIPRPKPSSSTTSPPIANPLPPSKNSPFVTNFNFVGTVDSAPYLCVPAALAYRASLGGEEAIRTYNTTLAQEGGKRIAELLGTEVMDNATRTLSRCCMTTVLLPLDMDAVVRVASEVGGQKLEKEETVMKVRDWMVAKLIDDYDTFLAMIFYGGKWWIRVSAQVYLGMEDFEWAAGILKEICGRVMKGEFLGEPKAKL